MLYSHIGPMSVTDFSAAHGCHINYVVHVISQVTNTIKLHILLELRYQVGHLPEREMRPTQTN